ncbi:biotin transporter BioY [Desulfosoma caldarium]|uniref:Biotin transporter n=1 Tax=Desulfosoma caldarium TaxID=610254 RepID=A0A3N1VPJ6_9BACT|nr:biotin transporter BioY [Desulfosoma caldarium]ROR01857.1 biotin transport system substrate-specific component [Desulfosoma caldarium]
MPLESIRRMVLVCLMTALIALGAQMAVPIGPVPVVLTNLFVLLAGLLLGPRQGTAAVALYLFLGALGLPVFAHFKGGLAHLAGPTGGYLLGFLAAAAIVGLLTHKRSSRLTDIMAVVVGSLVVYVLGVPWLKVVTGLSWSKAVSVGLLPFLVGDAVKAGVAVVLAWSLRPALIRHMRAASA